MRNDKLEEGLGCIRVSFLSLFLRGLASVSQLRNPQSLVTSHPLYTPLVFIYQISSPLLFIYVVMYFLAFFLYLFWSGPELVSESIKHVIGHFCLCHPVKSHCTGSLGSACVYWTSRCFWGHVVHVPLTRCVIHLSCWWSDNLRAALCIQLATWKWLHVRKMSLLSGTPWQRQIHWIHTCVVLSGEGLIHRHNDL